MMKKLVKMYIDAIKNAPENIGKSIEINRKKQELIEKEYEKNFKKDKES